MADRRHVHPKYRRYLTFYSLAQLRLGGLRFFSSLNDVPLHHDILS